VTTPPYAELVTAVRREGEGIAAAAGMGLDAPIPTCAGWDVTTLLAHVAVVYARISRLVSTRATEGPQSAPVLPEGDPLEVFRDLLDTVVAALSESEADTPVWNWAPGAPQAAMFWARRMAHESSVHRFDAQAAHGVVQPIDAELAADGIDELIDVVAHRVYTRDNLAGPTGTIRLQSTDNDSWHLRLEPDGPRRTDVISEPDVIANGTSSALLLAAYGRVPWMALEVTGDADLLTRWSTAMNF
jgi:uncharacterized protein (TIGR03083 family)